MNQYTIAIDQGTTSTRSIVYDQLLQPVASDQMEFTQHYPQSGWVEHDANEIWETVVKTVRKAIQKAGASSSEIGAIGITNQRETIVVWDKTDGKPIANAIVWQDRRTSDFCKGLENDGHEGLILQRTGLVIDPYFSASKLRWMLDEIDGARHKAESGQLLFGTIDSWLIWNLSGGKAHVTDATNAGRTQLYDIHRGQWDDDLLALFEIPPAMLPEVKNCADDFGLTDASLFGGQISINGVAGDQHAALIGQTCFKPGMMKSTYGTGCFAMLNTGSEAIPSKNRLLTTVGYQLKGTTTYALEGSIFIAGAGVQWLRDGLGLIESAHHSGAMAADADTGHHVYLVPAFVGLGAPHWDPDARGAIYGLTRNSGPAELARAVLESVGYQTRDLIQVMHDDWPGLGKAVLRVDGGMTASEWTMQFLADMVDCLVERPKQLETTALGAAYLAGFQSDLYGDMDWFTNHWQLDERFTPQMDNSRRDQLYQGWQHALNKTLT